jgi:two-component system sensor histidine kinase KdpD
MCVVSLVHPTRSTFAARGRVVGRGALKIFLGYAAGVGKSFHLFDEGRRRRGRGEDVVVASVQPDMPADVAPIAATFELFLSQSVEGPPSIDVPTLRQRHPQICLVDPLAHDNPPGGRHARRHEDVEELLDAGITVLTAIDIDYIEEQQAFVQSVTGRTRTQTVPQHFIESAEEVVLIDAPPHVLLAKRDGLAGGDRARSVHQLSLLREGARQLTADIVDRQLDAFLAHYGIPAHHIEERILVWMTPGSNAAAMLAAARREADCSDGTLLAVCLRERSLTEAEQVALAKHVACARDHQAHIDIVDRTDPADAILEYARSHRITQLFVGQEIRNTWRSHFGRTPIERVIDRAKAFEIRIFPDAI